MMRLTCAATLVALAGAVPAAAQMTDGWQGAKWGMAVEETIDALEGVPVQLQYSRGMPSSSCEEGTQEKLLAAYRFENRVFIGPLCFDASGGLAAVALALVTPERDARLLPELERVYGAPDMSESTQWDDLRHWYSGSTHVEWYGSLHPRLDTQGIRYRRHESSGGKGL